MRRQFYDRKGYPIHEGDLLKSFHFIGARRKRYWLYHVVVRDEQYDCLVMVPTQWLAGKGFQTGGRCWLSQDLADDAEIISGHGPGDCLSYEDRPRRKPEPAKVLADG